MVVAAGVAAVEPDVVEVETAPMVGLMDIDVAPETVHDNVVDCPGVSVTGLALKELITGAFGVAPTVTVADEVTDPRLLVAVNI
ncbi:MAG: hypothetical protein ACYDHZ_11200 [Dehalococcoidia bacterium]